MKLENGLKTNNLMAKIHTSRWISREFEVQTPIYHKVDCN